MRRPRLRSALLVAAVLSAGLPTIALANAPALHCRGITRSGSWEKIGVDTFKPVQGLSSPDTVSAFAVDETRPQSLAVSNGVRVQTSSDHGCDWSDSLALSFAPSGSQPFAGAGARIVSLALLGSTHVAAVQEGTGAASRPHVMVGTGDSWAAADSGLPAQGTPKLLRAANDGRTLYLTISPTGSGGETGSTTGLPGLPGGGGLDGETGLLYASTDRGHTWSLRTTTNALPTGGTGFTALDIDSSDSNRLYGIVSGHLAVSRDGGGSFTVSPESDFTALTAMQPQTLAAFRSSGQLVYSQNGGVTTKAFRAPGGVTGVAFRDGDSQLMVQLGSALVLLSPFQDFFSSAHAPGPPRAGTLSGDRSGQSSFHAVSGHSVLRYVDPVPKGVDIPPVAAGDTSVLPPNPGRVVPPVQSISLPVGTTGAVPFRLDLPKNDTPVDLFFLVDDSNSMSTYIDQLKANIMRIVGSLTSQKVDLRVGVGTLGTGSQDNEKPYPLTYVDPANPAKPYNRPVIYRRLRAVGPVNADLQAAVDNIHIETMINPYFGGGSHEGQLLALSQVAKGGGITTQAAWNNVPAGQDAHWRPSQSTRRIVILASDEAFEAPFPQKHNADYKPYFDQALRDLNDRRVQVIGMGVGGESMDDLRHVARGTHSFAPPGGIYCGIDPLTDEPENIRPGQPLACNASDHVSDAIIRVLSSLVDRQSVSLVPLTKTPVLGGLQSRTLTGLNVKKPNAAPFSVAVSCVNVKPGRYSGDVAAVLRGYKVGQARVNVTCVQAAAAVPPRPIPPAPGAPPPPANPPAPAVVPVVPPAPAPAVQAQVQVQTQVQVNPMSAGALQEQQELQLALALNGTLKDDDPAFNPGAQLAMVDRRKREQVQAMYLLAFAMTTCAGLGLARLRSRPEVQVRRAS
ncbi:MAG: VWA domain-containing protein [Streptomyces sp.]|uniref:vWA domain-containing protein n=1 Tax=Streptomyces sp. TaxID=1931 RepID=UPI0025E9DDA2|nr:vWA domain-containing protein [Streptomyces sp.]MBW8801210.1 VWA domain-containing protein [Streptomyces sp.]